MAAGLTVLWATDGSEPAMAAIPLLQSLVLPATDSLQVLTVAPEPLLSGARPDPVYYKRWSSHERQLALAEAEAIARFCANQLSMPAVAIDVRARFGHPIQEILRAASRMHADLIVVSAKGQSDLRLMLLGSVSQGVLQYANRPVLLVRPGVEALHTAVVGIDGSRAALKALAFVPRLAISAETQIVLTRAVQLIPLRRSITGERNDTYAREVRDVNERAMQTAARELNHAHQQIQDSGYKLHDDMPQGKAADQLIKAAAERDAGLIVVGSRPPSRARKYLLGSTAAEVAQEASVSVLVVR